MSLKRCKDSIEFVLKTEILHFRLEDVCTEIGNGRFILQILNNATSVYVLKVRIMKKQFKRTSSPLIANAARGELGVHYDRLPATKGNSSDIESGGGKRHHLPRANARKL